MELESSEPARKLDRMAIEATVQQVFRGRGSCDGRLQFDGIAGCYLVGVDVCNGDASWCASLPRDDGGLEMMHYGRVGIW